MVRDVSVIYPEAVKNPDKDVEMTDIPVLYLLHGMSGNQDTWLNRSGIDRLIRNTNLAIVMPSTDLAWYTNTTYGARYYDAIVDELPKVLQNFLPNLSTKREKNFIAGLSMGGYGAFKIALASNRFSYAASLSGALSFETMPQDSLGDLSYWERIFVPFFPVSQGLWRWVSTFAFPLRYHFSTLVLLLLHSCIAVPLC